MHFGIASRTIVLGIAVIAIIFAVNSRHFALLTAAEFRANDLRMASRTKIHPTGSVVVVKVDDDSIAKIGVWPWPRGGMAEVVNALTEYKVAAIGMDLLFTEPDAMDRDHQALASKLNSAGVPAATIESLSDRQRHRAGECLRPPGFDLSGLSVRGPPFRRPMNAEVQSSCAHDA